MSSDPPVITVQPGNELPFPITTATHSPREQCQVHRRVTVFELDDGTVQVRHAGKVLPMTQFDKLRTHREKRLLLQRTKAVA